MKKLILTSCFGMIISGALFAQPVSDRAVVPVAVTLNQILRLHIIDGGNIEFVFNTIEQFRSGIPNSVFYDTQFNVASSTNWHLDFGAEDPTLMGTDLDNTPGPQNTMPLTNVGFTITANGNYTPFGAANNVQLLGGSNADVAANGLGQFGVEPTQNPLIGAGALQNGGDILDNDFTIHWQCGIQPATGVFPTLGTTLLSQNLNADRYVTNVLFDLEAQ